MFTYPTALVGNKKSSPLFNLTHPHPETQAQDSLSANKRIRVISNRCTYIRRSLISKGKLFVSINEEIKAHDVIGKATLSAGFTVVNLSKKLNISPEDAFKCLQREVGKTIYKGELLAYKRGLLNKKFITAPTDGLIENYDIKTGELRLQFLPKEVPLTAGVAGIVEEVDQNRGEVLIKTMATEVFGVLGSGKERSGNLNILGSRGDLLHSTQVVDSMRQHIIVTGALAYGEALRKAAGFGVSGIITGGLNVADYKAIINTIDPKGRIGSDVGMTLFVSEGFGPLPIGEDIFEQLKAFDGKFVILHGNTSRLILPSDNPDSILLLRKTVLPTRVAPEGSSEILIGKIALGSKVRIIWPPYMGSQGKILEIDKTITKLESGISTYMLLIETPLKKIKVPFSNIELI